MSNVCIVFNITHVVRIMIKINESGMKHFILKIVEFIFTNCIIFDIIVKCFVYNLYLESKCGGIFPEELSFPLK